VSTNREADREVRYTRLMRTSARPVTVTSTAGTDARGCAFAALDLDPSQSGAKRRVGSVKRDRLAVGLNRTREGTSSRRCLPSALVGSPAR